MTYDIALYGHLTFDEVLHNTKFSTNVGGIVNVWKSLKTIDNKLNVYVAPLAIGESKIIIKNNIKDNYSNLNRTKYKFVPTANAKVSHVAYLNELQDFDFVESLHGIKTADLCTIHENEGTPLELTIAKKFDILFVSEEHLHLIPKEYKNRLVVHGPTRSTVYKNSKQIATCENEKDFLTNVNVLGAGDYFASCYIFGIIHGHNDERCLHQSQILTTKYLKDRHEKT